jgi:hypothetical protein
MLVGIQRQDVSSVLRSPPSATAVYISLPLTGVRWESGFETRCCMNRAMLEVNP